jgi:hypothetical protein
LRSYNEIENYETEKDKKGKFIEKAGNLIAFSFTTWIQQDEGAHYWTSLRNSGSGKCLKL